MFPGFLENLLASENLFCNAAGATQTALDIIKLLFNYSRDILGYTLPGRGNKEIPL